ncbi:MAG: NADPH:quinone oxidoreductase family protein [Alphaproteobacteria bacterium]|nr:NADPH:quinone oxidoreductase family protein [Alphaproteobacteria bacterium]
MRAIVCEKLGSPGDLVLRELPDPPAPGAGEIKVALTARGVQFVDVLMVAGEYQTKPPLPFIPGGEAAGEVIAVGPDVADFAIGGAVMTRHSPGSFAELATIPASAAMPVPKNMDLIHAAGFRSAYATSYHALVQRARLQPGEVLLVHGAAGGIGLAAVQIGKVLGATVIATAGSDEKLAVVAANGADHVINYTHGFRDRVKELTGGRGADVIYDPVGADVFDESMRCLNWGARILILGFVGGRAALAKTNLLLIKGASAVGVRMGGFNEFEPETAAANLRMLVEWAEAGKIAPHVSHTFPLDRVADALQTIIDRKVIGKCVITN